MWLDGLIHKTLFPNQIQGQRYNSVNSQSLHLPHDFFEGKNIKPFLNGINVKKKIVKGILIDIIIWHPPCFQTDPVLVNSFIWANVQLQQELTLERFYHSCYKKHKRWFNHMHADMNGLLNMSILQATFNCRIKAETVFIFKFIVWEFNHTLQAY